MAQAGSPAPSSSCGSTAAGQAPWNAAGLRGEPADSSLQLSCGTRTHSAAAAATVQAEAEPRDPELQALLQALLAEDQSSAPEEHGSATPGMQQPQGLQVAQQLAQGSHTHQQVQQQQPGVQSPQGLGMAAGAVELQLQLPGLYQLMHEVQEEAAAAERCQRQLQHWHHRHHRRRRRQQHQGVDPPAHVQTQQECPYLLSTQAAVSLLATAQPGLQLSHPPPGDQATASHMPWLRPPQLQVRSLTLHSRQLLRGPPSGSLRSRAAAGAATLALTHGHMAAADITHTPIVAHRRCQTPLLWTSSPATPLPCAAAQAAPASASPRPCTACT
jgi:hypothetical protein